MTRKLILLLVIGAAVSLPIFAQEPVTARQEQERAAERARIEDERNRINNQSNKNSAELIEWNRKMAIIDLSNRNRPNKPLSRKEIKEVKKNLAPSPEDIAAYKNFLKNSKGGLFRLMPNHDCTKKFVVTVKDGCEKSLYMGEYYSFVIDNYIDDSLFDLTYKNGYLISDGFWTQTILTSLGDVPLEDLTLTAGGLKYLTDFTPPRDNKAVKEQYAEISAGIGADGYQYSKRAKAILNNTYAMRLIRYRTSDDVFRRFMRHDTTSLDSKIISAGLGQFTSDLTLAFRIIRQDADGSLTILWKQLERKKSPKIIFQKNEPLSDIRTNQ